MPFLTCVKLARAATRDRKDLCFRLTAAVTAAATARVRFFSDRMVGRARLFLYPRQQTSIRGRELSRVSKLQSESEKKTKTGDNDDANAFDSTHTHIHNSVFHVYVCTSHTVYTYVFMRCYYTRAIILYTRRDRGIRKIRQYSNPTRRSRVGTGAIIQTRVRPIGFH